MNPPRRPTRPDGSPARATTWPAGSVSTVAGQGTAYANPVTTTSVRLRRPGRVHIGLHRDRHRWLRHRHPHRHHRYDAAGRVLSDDVRPGSAHLLRLRHRRAADRRHAAGDAGHCRPPRSPSASATTAAGNKTRMVDGNGNATIYTYNSWNLPESTIEPSTTAHPNAIRPDLDHEVQRRGSDHPVGTAGRGHPHRHLRQARPGHRGDRHRSDHHRPEPRLRHARRITVGQLAGRQPHLHLDRPGPARLGRRVRRHHHLHLRRRGATSPSGSTPPAPPRSPTTRAGRLATVVDPLTATTATYTYDAAGRLSTVTRGSTGTPAGAYTYDNLGRIATDATKRPNAHHVGVGHATATTSTTC